MAYRLLLYRAQPHPQYGGGRVHYVDLTSSPIALWCRYPLDRTPGNQFYGTEDEVTCQNCLNRITSYDINELAQLATQQEELEPHVEHEGGNVEIDLDRLSNNIRRRATHELVSALLNHDQHAMTLGAMNEILNAVMEGVQDEIRRMKSG